MNRDETIFSLRFTGERTLDLKHNEPSAFVTVIRGTLTGWDDEDREAEAGRVFGWKVHLDVAREVGQDAWEVMDAEDGELESAYRQLFDANGDVKPAVLRASGRELQPANLIVLQNVIVAPPWRGHKLGGHLAQATLETFGDDYGTLLVLLPYPLERDDMDGADVQRAAHQLTKYWERQGFRPAAGTRWLAYWGKEE